MQIELNGLARVRPLMALQIGEYFVIAIDPRAVYQRVAGENETDLCAVVIDSDGYLDARTSVMIGRDIPVWRVSPVVIYKSV